MAAAFCEDWGEVNLTVSVGVTNAVTIDKEWLLVCDFTLEHILPEEEHFFFTFDHLHLNLKQVMRLAVLKVFHVE